jgi:hypothetical protein
MIFWCCCEENSGIIILLSYPKQSFNISLDLFVGRDEKVDLENRNMVHCTTHAESHA